MGRRCEGSDWKGGQEILVWGRVGCFLVQINSRNRPGITSPGSSDPRRLGLDPVSWETSKLRPDPAYELGTFFRLEWFSLA